MKSNKTWIHQLSNSYIRQKLNEMAMSVSSEEAASELAPHFGIENSPVAIPLRNARRQFTAALQSHPTMVFDHTGNHIGHIQRVGLDGKPLDPSVTGISPEDIQKSEDRIRIAARVLNDTIDEHNLGWSNAPRRASWETGIYPRRTPVTRLGDEHRPHSFWLEEEPSTAIDAIDNVSDEDFNQSMFYRPDPRNNPRMRRVDIS